MRQRKLLPSAARMEPFCRSGFVEASVQFAPSLPIGRLPPPTTSQGWNMCKPDVWLRERFWERVWTGPGAVATYLSLPLSLVRVVLADRLQPQLERPSLWILATDILVGIGLMLVDGICPARNHHLQLFRLSSERSR